MDIEVAPEPTPEEREAIERALRRLLAEEGQRVVQPVAYEISEKLGDRVS